MKMSRLNKIHDSYDNNLSTYCQVMVTIIERYTGLNKDDIRSLTRISRSLWGDVDQSIAISEDTLTSVSLLRLSDDRTIERASKVMIERAEKNPPTLLRLNHPFFRLAPIERFLLTVLHVEKWSYARVARALGIEKNLIETWAWATRIKYCFQEAEMKMDYPHGPATLGPACPDYNPSSPWTQRMLDDELGKRDRLFLQNHLMACDRCRKTLELSKKVHFKVESLIPVRESSAETDAAAERIFEIWKQGETILRPMTAHSGQSFITFLSMPKVQFMMTAFGVFCLYWFTRR